MLYLEDYLEMIEHLPQELRDRFTDMREMDLSIHNNMDELEKRMKIFFNECKRHQNTDIPQTVESEYQLIRKEYYKTLEDADEKVHLASQMYDLVDKYLRRLDSELHKFKCELEADNKGITEVLEKRSLELDTPTPGTHIALQQKENRYDSVSSSSVRYSRPRSEKRRDSGTSLQQFAEKRQAVTPTLSETRHSSSSGQNSTAVAPNIAYSLGHSLGAGPAIAAAASQAIAATQQMQQGRRTASLKASYEAINPGGHGHEFGIGRELAGAAQTAIQAIQQDHANNKKKHKKWNGSGSNSAPSAQPMLAAPAAGGAAADAQKAASEAAAAAAAAAAAVEAGYSEWTDEPVDPNEPRYCLCNQVSYGDMVACDNEECSTEWFHYSCVGINAPPKGKWYCPTCTATMKRRNRKN